MKQILSLAIIVSLTISVFAAAAASASAAAGGGAASAAASAAASGSGSDYQYDEQTYRNNNGDELYDNNGHINNNNQHNDENMNDEYYDNGNGNGSGAAAASAAASTASGDGSGAAAAAAAAAASGNGAAAAAAAAAASGNSAAAAAAAAASSANDSAAAAAAAAAASGDGGAAAAAAAAASSANDSSSSAAAAAAAAASGDGSAAAAAAAAASGDGSAAAAAAAAASGNGGAASAAAAAAASSADGAASAAAAAAASSGSASAAAAAAAASGNGAAASAAAAAASGNGAAAAAAAAASSNGGAAVAAAAASSSNGASSAAAAAASASSANDINMDIDYDINIENSRLHPTSFRDCHQKLDFWYQGSCIEKTCLNDKLSRVKLDPYDDYSTNQGLLSNAIMYQVQTVSDANGYAYEVVISYTDIQNNQLVGDPLNCVDYRLYQTRNSFDINHDRMYVTVEGDIPSWPQSSYRFNTISETGQVTFRITQGDLDARQCVRLTSGTVVQWQCFFELAFVVKGVTQISYYLCIQVQLNTSVDTGTSTPAVNFLRIVQIDGCPPAQSVCTVAVTVNSEILFCDDGSCQQVSEYPAYPLYLNRPFWMLHRITDSVFANSWFINNVAIFYQAYGFSLTMSGSEFEITKHNHGYNIYRLTVPIVASEVIISAGGDLVQSSRVLVENSSKSQVKSSANAGEVGVDTNQDVADSKTDSSRIQDSARPGPGPAQKTTNSANDAAILITGATIIAAITQ